MHYNKKTIFIFLFFSNDKFQKSKLAYFLQDFFSFFKNGQKKNVQNRKLKKTFGKNMLVLTLRPLCFGSQKK